jgi:hypothetical protein
MLYGLYLHVVLNFFAKLQNYNYKDNSKYTLGQPYFLFVCEQCHTVLI